MVSSCLALLGILNILGRYSIDSLPFTTHLVLFFSSGEDPAFGAAMAAAAVAGIQSNGVIANAKHYMVCDQDTMRSDVSQNVDERTRMEIYAPAFHGAVEAGVASVMCSCESPYSPAFLARTHAADLTRRRDS